MKRLDDVALLAAPSSRSNIYAEMLERENLLPNRLLYLRDPDESTAESQRRKKERPEQGPVLPEDPHLDASVPAPERLRPLGVEDERIATLDPNSSICKEALQAAPEETIVYSGPGGAILERSTLETADTFLHVHAGVLPEYRGSTTIYYSLLNGDSCGATAFLLTPGLDQGPVVHSRSFPPPKDPTTLDLYYDPWVRAKVLVEVLERYDETGEFTTESQDPTEGETYFIIHPVLKHLAILGLQAPASNAESIQS